MKRWGLGTYHGLRRKHVDSYLNEFVFRYNRRFYRHVSFETLLGILPVQPALTHTSILQHGRLIPGGRHPLKLGQADPQRDRSI